ncbi:enhanced serine sensitivity protein SseB [Enterococcus faecalis]|uniref:enhanced serine sensitivity protein SseB C-terminal domain-containing protein n=1 Tax=Enterococcus faecalis TaxID=1351 RepID=UPI0011420E2F|nr:enhanced serine sensitivity protein SseB C-terminal domain-containing protein [Enterococcus faecalis]EIA6622774.1 enhanced serine sensitivity protein SseB [Enterococcus faecalis]MBP4075303.1 enhanced serine sensitivity protein SseB [Enterococcus faecalis]MBP4093411.1 enhanced serine sensitivity protein SseB [Enterococcus faecalis]MUN82245.1 enhanced serine sensitivity protein SseB [Enterococcus faecalis]NGG30017.1 enhanced serine sensitivity protein SseB [Enterococcus faecalis]
MEQEEVKNPELVTRIERIKKDYTQKNEQFFYEKLEDSKLLLPVNFDSKNKLNIIKIEDSVGNDYIPAFTDWENLRLGEESNAVVFTIYDYLKIIQEDLSITGIVINPYSQNLVLNRGNLEFIKSNSGNIKKNEQVSIGIPREYPEFFVDKCKKIFKKETKINKAFLLQMVRKNLQKSYLLVIDSKDEDQILPYVSNKVQKYLGKEDILDIISLNSDFGRNVTKEYNPFYEK